MLIGCVTLDRAKTAFIPISQGILQVLRATLAKATQWYIFCRLASNNGWEIAPYLQLCVILLRLGDDLASTWVAKPEVHAENVE